MEGRVLFSVLIPVLNEQDNILPLLEELYATLRDGPPFEVLVIDDGSDDATLARARSVLAAYPALRLLSHSVRCGKSAALRTGAKAAIAPWLVTLDGDRQNDPGDIPRLLALAQAQPDLAMVAGNRRRRDDTLAKRITSRLGNGIRRAFLRDACPDTACGLKLIRRDLFLDLPIFDSLHRFLPALVQGRGYSYANLPINDRARVAGRSKYTNLGRAAVGLFDLLGVMWLLRRTTVPVKVVEEGRP